MAATQKVSVAMGRDELRLAKTAARHEGMSLSAYVTRAVRDRLEERQRMEAAQAFLASFSPDELPSEEEQRELIDLWMGKREAPARPAKARRARRTRPR